MEAFNCRLLNTEEALAALPSFDIGAIRRRDMFWTRVTPAMLRGMIINDAIGVAVHRNGGFLFLECSRDPDTDQRALHVFAAHAAAPGTFDDGARFVDHLARDLGAAEITFGSERRGWQKIAPRYGYNRRTHEEYVKRVSYE